MKDSLNLENTLLWLIDMVMNKFNRILKLKEDIVASNYKYLIKQQIVQHYLINKLINHCLIQVICQRKRKS